MKLVATAAILPTLVLGTGAAHADSINDQGPSPCSRGSTGAGNNEHTGCLREPADRNPRPGTSYRP
jgi:hypothetical protein